MNKIFESEIIEYFGVAIIILAICIGIGKCSVYLSTDYLSIEKEKTKQLELQLKIEKQRKQNDRRF